MSSSTSKSAILIIHGGYFFAPAWDPFRAVLSRSGYTTACPQLPSCGDKKPTKSGQPDDIAAVQSAARELIASGHRITVLAHSYGGVVACGAITDDLLAPASDPNAPGIAKLVFLSAWIPQPGKTLEDVIAKYGFQSKVELGFNEDGTAYGTNTATSFFNDILEVDEARAKSLAEATTTHNWVANALAVQGDPYKRVPTTYVHCLRDQAILLPLQKDMVRDVVEAGAKVDVKEIDAGHCPFLSRPDEVVEILKEAS